MNVEQVNEFPLLKLVYDAFAQSFVRSKEQFGFPGGDMSVPTELPEEKERKQPVQGAVQPAFKFCMGVEMRPKSTIAENTEGLLSREC